MGDSPWNSTGTRQAQWMKFFPMEVEHLRCAFWPGLMCDDRFCNGKYYTGGVKYSGLDFQPVPGHGHAFCL